MPFNKIISEKDPKVESIVPTNNGVIMTMEIYRSGKTIDGRVITAAEVREIYRNTTEKILSQDITIPVKFGHFDQDQTLKGEVVGLACKRKRKKTKKASVFGASDLYLIAQVMMFEDAYSLWEAGKLKNVSPEIAEEGYDENGENFGKYLCGLALLGTDPPAIPWLKTQYGNTGDVYYYFYMKESSMFGKKPKPKTLTNQKPKKEFAATDTIAVPRSDIEDWLSMLETLLESTAPAEGTEDMPMEEPSEEGYAAEPPVDENDKDAYIKKLEAQLAELQAKADAEGAFSLLVSAGKLKQDGKEKFFNLAAKTGVKFAMEFFKDSETLKTPPKDAKIGQTNATTSTSNDPEFEAKAKEYFEYYKQPSVYNQRFPGKDDAYLQNYARMSAQNFLKREEKK